MLLYLYDPIPSLQGPIVSSRTVVKDVLNKNASHHLSVVQPAAHPPSPDDTDPQGLAWLSEELHSEEGRSQNQHAGFSTSKAVTVVLIGCSLTVSWTCSQN